jgi:hypothetical protein
MILVWLLVFASHAACAAVWWWLMPGGFPSSTSELWVNQVLPFVPILVAAIALFTRGAFSASVVPALQAMFPLFWIACAISARVAFPESIGGLWNLPFAGGVLLAILWGRQHRFRTPKPWLVPLFAIPALWAGWCFPTSQRSADAATLPSQVQLFEVPASARNPGLIKLSKDAQLHTDDGRLVVRSDKLVLTVQPLLSIASRSPDRSWTELAPPDYNRRTIRNLVSVQHDGPRWKLSYKDEDRSVLDLGAHDGVLDLDARSRLPAAVFSHLNQFAEVTLRGHSKVTVAFSPIPGKRIELPSPTEPARFAYLDDAGRFHVVQASKQRVGPFTEIASGPLKRGEPLIVTLEDADAEVFRIVLDDWAAQASTQLSPTAGWGVPVNSIELVRVAEAQNAPIAITWSLASTSIGRGSQSVGLAPGVYRDRITISR